MKNVVTLTLILFSLVACTPAKHDGVHVGNGLKSYASTAGFSFDYDMRLDLDEKPDKKRIILANATLSKDKVSELTIDIEEKTGIKDMTELKMFAEGQVPGAAFDEVDTAGAKALRHEKTVSQGKAYRYFFLTPTKAVVSAALLLVQGSVQAQLLLDAVQSTRVDLTPPQVAEVKIDRTVIKAGEKVTVRVKTTDDVSGVETAVVALYPYTKSRLEFPKGDALYQSPISVKGKLTPTADKDLYEIELSTSAFAAPSEYQISAIVTDKAGNQSQPLAGTIVQVENDNKVDITPPAITEITVPKKLVPGKSNKIQITAKDDVAGIKEGFFKSGMVVFKYLDKNKFPSQVQSETTVIRHVFGDTYEMEFDISSYVEPGKLVLSKVDISDIAGNTANYVYFGKGEEYPGYEGFYWSSFRVRHQRTDLKHPLESEIPEALVEKSRPKIVDVWFSDKTLKPGQRPNLFIQTDVPVKSQEIEVRANLVKLFPGTAFHGQGAGFTHRGPLLGPYTTRNGTHVYLTQVDFGKWIPRGMYAVGNMSLELRMWNSSLDSIFWTEGGDQQNEKEKRVMPKIEIKD